MAESDVKMGVVKWFNSMTKRGFDPPSKSTAFEAWEVAAVEEAEVTDLIEADAGTTAQAEETVTAEPIRWWRLWIWWGIWRRRRWWPL
ncbi:hypothetical protein PHJA_000764900 [Phtheirospermum japonicum]|uniref:Uncharacterized protein n=1 Tax=Phtheirospermum japonicum TaxID=374723 RepID=A0A830BVR3_9LAMI|nr:hypothetical protein PHJA_000764900 [Phtheirospermum japonicum]